MTNPLTCLIIDDEPSAQQIMRQYISNTPGLILSGICKNALEAMDHLRKNPIDIIFLDINMPGLSGISFLKSLQHPPCTILTTAYDEYALEGYELNVLDYLLKPFSFERFLRAVGKARDRLDNSNVAASQILTIKADGKIYRIDVGDIHYIESLGDYVSIITSDSKLVTYETLKNLERELPKSEFIRVHKSFIIALNRVDYLEGNMLRIAGKHIPVGATYRDKIRSYFSP